MSRRLASVASNCGQPTTPRRAVALATSCDALRASPPSASAQPVRAEPATSSSASTPGSSARWPARSAARSARRPHVAAPSTEAACAPACDPPGFAGSRAASAAPGELGLGLALAQPARAERSAACAQRLRGVARQAGRHTEPRPGPASQTARNTGDSVLEHGAARGPSCRSAATMSPVSRWVAEVVLRLALTSTSAPSANCSAAARSQSGGSRQSPRCRWTLPRLSCAVAAAPAVRPSRSSARSNASSARVAVAGTRVAAGPAVTWIRPRVWTTVGRGQGLLAERERVIGTAELELDMARLSRIRARASASPGHGRARGGTALRARACRPALVSSSPRRCRSGCAQHPHHVAERA